MATLEIDGAKLDYVERGRGDAVVLIHGSCSDRRTWEGVINSLSARFRVVAYSRRYHWPNAPIVPGADYPMAEQLDDLDRALERLGLGPAHLVGHSYGGFLALLLALRRPTAVRSMVLSEPPLLTLFVSARPRPWELARLFVTRPRAATALARLVLGGFIPAVAAIRRRDPDRAFEIFGRAALGPGAFAGLSAERRAQARQNFIAAELVGSGFLPLDSAAIASLDVPTLLIQGRESPPIFHRVLDRLARLLPRAKRISVPNARHLVHEDAPEAFAAALEAFVRVPISMTRDSGSDRLS